MRLIALLSSMFVIFSLLSSQLQAQNLDEQLKSLAEKIASRINETGKKKVAVWGFVDEKSADGALGRYLTEDFSVYITNFSNDGFEVVDRNHIDILLREHKLNSEGYIDEATAKELKKIIAADAVITGTYTVLTSKIRVRAKVLDTETALQFAADIVDLPINDDISSYLGVSKIGSGKDFNRGFNRPLNSREHANDPSTVDQKCAEENFGDLCFANSTSNRLIVLVKFRDSGGFRKEKDITINSGDTKCFLRMPEGEITYYAAEWEKFEKDFKATKRYLHHQYYTVFLLDKGEIEIETCQSKTFAF